MLVLDVGCVLSYCDRLRACNRSPGSPELHINMEGGCCTLLFRFRSAIVPNEFVMCMLASTFVLHLPNMLPLLVPWSKDSWTAGTLGYTLGSDWRLDLPYPKLCCWASEALNIHSVHLLAIVRRSGPDPDMSNCCRSNSAVSNWPILDPQTRLKTVAAKRRRGMKAVAVCSH